MESGAIGEERFSAAFAQRAPPASVDTTGERAQCVDMTRGNPSSNRSATLQKSVTEVVNFPAFRESSRTEESGSRVP